jgi:hypothetical protein
MQLHSVKTKKQHSRNLVSRGEVKETKQIAERVQGYDQGLEKNERTPGSLRSARTYDHPSFEKIGKCVV